jgi:hypothetical protein
MPCDRTLKKNQTVSGRIAEIRKAVQNLSAALAAGRVKVVIGPQGGIAFQGWLEQERDGVGDICAYRQIMRSGSALAKAAIMRAEQLAGRTVDKQAMAHGHHSHDGGATWHHGH